MKTKILTVVGARPQFIKAAPITRAFADRSDMVEVMVHTGQHFDDDMSQIFFRELGIPVPAHNLGVHGGGHGEMTGRMLEKLEQLMLSEKPSRVLVFGDTNSTLAGAVAAAKLRIPVAHVEAGLRSFNRAMPEEINRLLTDHVSDLLFCPTEAAVTNLTREGILRGVHHVGDVMFDATVWAACRARTESQILDKLGLRRGAFALATIHRAENTDDPAKLAEVLDYLKTRAKQLPVVLPLHPRTRQAAERHGLVFGVLKLLQPVGYVDMAALLDGCAEVLTDSGGLQKEAYFHRKPCVTLRSETEWTETVACGWNRLWKERDYAPRTDISDYGDGHAASHVVDIIGEAA